MNASYYVHRTMTGKEFEAVIALRPYGYSCYVPWVETRSRRGAEQLAFFAGYIFVRDHIVWQKHREAIIDRNENHLVIGAVTIGGAAIPIPESELANIARRAAKVRVGDEAEPLAPRFKPGDIGIMRDGPYEGQKCPIELIEGEDADVALRIFNAVRTVRVKVYQLEAAE